MKFYITVIFIFALNYSFAQKNKLDLDTNRVNNLNDVVVTGQFAPQSLKQSVYNVRTISAQKIKLRAATNVQQVLSTELGFRFSNDLTLGTADIQLMGMTGRNVKILLDGIALPDRSDTRESLNQIDINTVERIEIVEGPMSVIYGTDALAGVINIITKKANGSFLSLSARLQDETAGNEYAFLKGAGNHIKNINGSWNNKTWKVMLGLTNNDFGGWNLPAKTATIAQVSAITNIWKPKQQWLANTKIGYSKNAFNIWYKFDGVNEDIDTRHGINEANHKSKLQTYTTNRFGQQLQADYRVNDKLKIDAVAGYTSLERKTKSLIHDYTTGIEELSTGTGEQDVAKFNATMFRFTSFYKIINTISIQPGVEFNRDGASGQRITGRPVISDYALFLSTEIIPVVGINIRPSVRFIKNSIYDAPPLIPSINTKFSLNKDFDLRLAYARGYRAPALRELYYNFIDASHTIIGNSNLKAEESNSFNGSIVWAGIKGNNLKFNSTLAGFYNAVKNRIDYGMDAGDNSVTTLINVSKYKTTGGTIDNKFTYNNLEANLGFSYIGRYNSLSESNADLDLPEFVWSPEISSNLNYTSTKLNGSISIFYKYSGSRPNYQIEANGTAKLVKVGAFSLADLMLNKNISKNLTLNAGIKNLFNVTQLTNTASSSVGAHDTGGGSVPYSYGRSYALGLLFTWNKI
jgi:outer membrane receptor for ferrienterochelin and colicins